MLTFFLHSMDFANGGVFRLYLLFISTALIVWLLRMVVSRRYKPWTEPHEITTAVIVPVVDEPVEIFEEVLRRIQAQQPDEFLVVINGPQNVVLEGVCERHGIDFLWTPIPGKRGAIALGVSAVTSEAVVIVDSDTLWTPDTLAELTKPLADPTVGGVTTRQHVFEPERTMWTRWADWIESVRTHYSTPAMSVMGTVGCLPGRTITFRREILERNMKRFLGERFLGVFLEISDDRTLTNYALKDGFKTVYQSTSVVYTDAPTNARTMVKQQYRWSKGSQYNTLRMLPWMLCNARFLALLFVADIILPFMLVSILVAWLYHALFLAERTNIFQPLLDQLGGGTQAVAIIVALIVVTSVVLCGLRFTRSLRDRMSHLLWIPVYMVLALVILVPIRVYGFMRMAHPEGWGTRVNAYSGAAAVSSMVLIPYLLAGSLMGGLVFMGIRT
jgi:hyaluronan synthase